MISDAEEAYSVHAVWTSTKPISDETLKALGAGLQSDDDSFCFWVDAKDPLSVIASWDLRAASIERAARLCKAAISELTQQQPDFEPRLREIGVSTDDGYWVTTNPDSDLAD